MDFNSLDNTNVRQSTSPSDRRNSKCALPKKNSSDGVPHFQSCAYYSSMDSNREPRLITRTTSTYIPLPEDTAYRGPSTSLTQRSANSRSSGFQQGGLVKKYPRNQSRHFTDSGANRDGTDPFQSTIINNRRQTSFFDRLFSSRNVFGAINVRRSPIRHLRISSLASARSNPNFRYSATLAIPSRRYAYVSSHF